MVDGWAERGYLSLRALFGPRPLTPTDHPYPTLWNSPTLLEPTEAPPPGSAKAKALQSLNRIRVRVYDSFLRRAGAKSVDDLVLSTDGQPDSPWCWAVNYCELGGPLEERRRDLLSRFDSEDKPVWVPLIGAPYSLLRFPSSSSACRAVVAQRALNLHPPPGGETKPLFLELARPDAVAFRLPPVPGHYVEEGAVEIAPGRREWPCGVEVWEDFVTEEEERGLIQKMREVGNWSEGVEKRLSVHFGPHFDYTTNATKELVNPLPPWASSLLSRFPYQDRQHLIDQMTGQLYPGGSGIPPHVDTHSPFGEVIWGLSLGSTVTMELKECGEIEARRMREPKRSLSSDPNASTPPIASRPSTPIAEKTQLVLVDLKPRSLLILRGPSRYAYTHGIRPKKADQVGIYGEKVRPRADRYSLTFRTVKKEEDRTCDCQWERWCDTRF